MARKKDEITLYPENIIKETFKNDKIDEGHFDLNFEKAKNSFLNNKESYVLEQYFKEGKTLDEIGLSFGVGKERVRQMKYCAECKLRKYKNMFMTYVESTNKNYTSISVLHLEEKSRNALIRNNILSIEELKAINYEDLLKLPSIGMRIANDITNALRIFNNDENPSDKYIYKEVKRLLDKYDLTFSNLTRIMNTYEK